MHNLPYGLSPYLQVGFRTLHGLDEMVAVNASWYGRLSETSTHELQTLDACEW